MTKTNENPKLFVTNTSHYHRDCVVCKMDGMHSPCGISCYRSSVTIFH